MKVIITTSNPLFPPASGRATRALAIAEYLNKSGFDVTILSPDRDIDPLELEQFRGKYDLAFFKQKRPWQAFFGLSFLKALAAEIKKNETCVIVEQPHLGLMVHFLSKILRFPYILDEHMIEFLRLKTQGKPLLAKLFYPLEKLLIKKCAAVLAVSHNECMLIKGRTEREPLLVPNGVNIDRFYPAEKNREMLAHLDMTQFKIIIFVGNFASQINSEAAETINSLIAPKVYEKREDVRFLLIGQDPPPLHYHPAVISVGYVRDVAQYLNLADIVIAPLSADAGTRTKILEALACGKIVISSFLGAKGLQVENGKDIVLCSEGDFPAKILACLDGEACRDIPAQARKKALDYDWELILNPLKKLIFEHEEKTH
jgi:glycosyltransferase involved in cell wall biosynthesis